VKQVLDILGESLQAVRYDPFGHYHFPEASFPVYSNAERSRRSVLKVTNEIAREFQQFQKLLLAVYQAMKGISTIVFRSDWQLIPVLLERYLPSA